jgi:putative transposase
MKTIIRHRHLPHWDVPGATYFITSCLGRDPPVGVSAADWELQREKLIFARTDHWLDSESAVRHLADSQLARIVIASMFHFAEEKYDLLAYVVMPSHFHWVFQPLDAWAASLGSSVQQRPPRERVMHGLKSFTGRECNQLLDQEGTFWQDESYDHYVRDQEELHRIIRYVEQNPVKAGLVEDVDGWEFSSSRLRTRFGIQYGESIQKRHLL